MPSGSSEWDRSTTSRPEPEDVGRPVVILAGGALPYWIDEVIHVYGGLLLPKL
jgi:hypothetical protein